MKKLATALLVVFLRPTGRRMFLLCLFVLLMQASVPVLAQDVVSQPTKVTHVRQFSTNASIFFSTEATPTNPAACPNALAYWTQTEDVAKNVKGMLSLLLTAKATGQSVVIQVSGTVCHNGYPTPNVIFLAE